MFQERIPLYRQLEEARGSKLLVYITGDRRGMETQIHNEVVDYFIDHLDIIGEVPKLSLLLHTRGGRTLAAWSIANLILQFSDEFEVIVPSRAHSAGTLLALGANRIVMTKQATLGPIDPSVNTPLNPKVPGTPPDGPKVSVNVEAINGFIEWVRETGIEEGDDLATIVTLLAEKVHPLVLGQVFRTRSQIRMLGQRLLSKHRDDQKNIDEILSFLCSESGSHDYTIYRKEARDELGLDVIEPSDDYALIKSIYDDIAEELKLTTPYKPEVVLGDKDQKTYSFARALIESADAGSHRYISEGRLVRRQLKDKSGAVKEAVQDMRTYEGWRYEQIQE